MLAEQDLPSDVLQAWISMNAGHCQRKLHRIASLLRLGTYEAVLFPRAVALDCAAAFVVNSVVLGISGSFLAIEPDADVAGFLLP